jgi:hypothetical protein
MQQVAIAGRLNAKKRRVLQGTTMRMPVCKSIVQACGKPFTDPSAPPLFRRGGAL